MNRFAGVLTTGAALAGLASMFAVLGGCGDDVTPSSASAGKHGSLLNAQEFLVAPQALPAAALLEPPVAPTLPAKVVLTNTPNAQAQGTATDSALPGRARHRRSATALGRTRPRAHPTARSSGTRSSRATR